MKRIILILAALLLAAPAFAAPKKGADLSAQRRGLTGNVVQDVKNLRTDSTDNVGGGKGLQDDLLGALEAKLLPDLKYALNVANGSGDTLTAPCWTAWIAMIEARNKANVDDQGNPLPMPDPALITKFQKLMDIRNALQPTSPFMRACSPVAGVVKSDIRKFIGLVLTGGASLAAMGIGL